MNLEPAVHKIPDWRGLGTGFGLGLQVHDTLPVEDKHNELPRRQVFVRAEHELDQLQRGFDLGVGNDVEVQKGATTNVVTLD